MFTIKHTLKGWRLCRADGSFLSCLAFSDFYEAIAYLRASYPAEAASLVAALKCEACSSTREVEPEQCGPTYLLCCRRCRACPITATGPADHLGKVAKHTHVVREPSRAEWIEECRAEVKKFNLKSTGVQSLDDALLLPEAPKRETYPFRAVVAADDAPTDCTVCGGPLNGSFVDGVMAYSGWGYQHESCHKANGIGLGVGRGYLYLKREDGSYARADLTPKPAPAAEAEVPVG